MNGTPSAHDQFWTLANAYCNGVADEVQAAQLELLLHGNPEQRRQFIDLCQIHADLFSVIRADWAFDRVAAAIRGSAVARADASPVEDLLLAKEVVSPGDSAGIASVNVTGSSPGSRLTLGAMLQLVAALAVSLLIAGFVMFLLRPQPRDGDGADFKAVANHDAPPDDDSPAALINDAQHARWSPETAPTGRLPEIRPGRRLKLESGYVDLQLVSGVRLTIEGPAEWTIEQGNMATLKAGRMMAWVPRQAVGFTLETPSARVVDLGTEFGAEVSAEGTTDVHVSSGLVDVISRASTNLTPTGRTRLNTGQAARVLAGGRVVRVAADGLKSARPLLQQQTRRVLGTRMIDLRSGVVATQSSQYEDDVPSQAFDGDQVSMSQTAVDDVHPWWQIDLGKSHPIIAVQIMNRENYFQSRMSNVVVTILAEDGVTVQCKSPILNKNNEVYGGMEKIHAGPVDLVFDASRLTGAPVQGRFIRVERVGSDKLPKTDDPCPFGLNITEIQIFQSGESSWKQQ